VSAAPRRTTAGHVYVVKFANDMVKVGRAARVGSRVQSHMDEGMRHGNAVVVHWSSPPLDRVDLVETMLIEWCESQPAAVGHFGREWFTGLDYAATVDAASRLGGHGEVQRLVEGRIARAGCVVGGAARPTPPTAPAPVVRAERVVRKREADAEREKARAERERVKAAKAALVAAGVERVKRAQAEAEARRVANSARLRSGEAIPA
jgi:hypothetical protein